MLLPPELIRAVPWPTDLEFFRHPIQTGLERSPWHVTVASVLLQKARKNVDVTKCVFENWPTPEALAASDEGLEYLLHPLGLHRTRTRHLQQLSRKWNLNVWSDLRELNGVGKYVAAAVGLYCFNCTDDVGCDHVLLEHAQETRYLPAMSSHDGYWWVDEVPFPDPLTAYARFAQEMKDAESER